MFILFRSVNVQVIEYKQEVKDYVFTDNDFPIKIGRKKGCNIVLNDQNVSMVQNTILIDKNNIILKDGGDKPSRNGSR